VNVFKHGEGSSFEQLKSLYPDYIDRRRLNLIKVNVDQLKGFSEAVAEFWSAVLENILASQIVSVPAWFETVIPNTRRIAITVRSDFVAKIEPKQ
jgi:hypothetical protein